MIIRTISIKSNMTIDKFAKMMGIKNYFLCNEQGSDTIDFSFYERRESWICYDNYIKVKDGYDYYIEINIYIDYNEFWLLLLNASNQGFDICLPDEFSISPYINEVFENGHILKAYEEEIDNDDVFKLRYDSNLNNEIIFEQALSRQGLEIGIFLYWSYKKGLLIELISKILDDFEEPKGLDDFLVLLKNSIVKPILYNYFFKDKNNGFTAYYLYNTKLWFYDLIENTIGIEQFNTYLSDLEERNILGKDFIKIWLDYHQEINFTNNAFDYKRLFEVFDLRYDEYLMKKK